MQPNYLPKVREQYEALPYPPYDPAQDKIQLVTTWNDRLDYLNHRFYDGRQRFGSDFRVLVAGDGTGHASIFLAEQLAALGGQVVSLDLSSASQAIAKERAAIRKLTNITHINASLLDIPSLNLGEFDFISCSGVLHHLSDPDAGLRALASALKPEGIVSVMVYATIGRTSVYQMQEMLRRLFGTDTPMDEQLAITRSILPNLPPTNWFWFNNQAMMNDITKFGDSGIFDLLLHTQDRSYTAPQCHEWVQRCGLNLLEFVPIGKHEEVVYNPLTYVNDEAFAARVGALPLIERQAVAELLAGNLFMHLFHASRAPQAAELTIDDDSLIASWAVVSPITPSDLNAILPALRSALGKKKVSIPIPGTPIHVRLTPTPCAPDLIQAIDGQRTIGQLLDEVAAKHPQQSRDDIQTQWRTLYGELRHQQAVVLRRAEGVSFPSCLDLQKRSAARMKA